MITCVSFFCSADSSLRAYSGLLCPSWPSQLPCKSYDIKLIKSSSLKEQRIRLNPSLGWVQLVGQELLSLPGHLSSPPVFSGYRVARSLVFYVMFCM